MSTNRKRLNSAIQRIAREDPEIRKLLDEFRNSGGKPRESATSGSGAEDRQICCDGSSPDNINPGSDTRDPNENPQDGIDPDEPAKISDNLTGVTDCNTGHPICFEGSDWIPQEGWDAPTEPPLEEGYEEGSVWFLTTGGTAYYSNYPCGVVINVRSNQGFTVENCRLTSTFDNRVIVTYTLYDAETGELAGEVTSAVDKEPCEVSNPSPTCNDPPPLVEAWPEDGCVNLAIKGGKIVGSKFDPENDGSYSAPRDEVELCDAFGNSFKLKASGSIEGGWKSISAQNPDDGYLYNAQGQQIARISESEYSDPTM